MLSTLPAPITYPDHLPPSLSVESLLTNHFIFILVISLLHRLFPQSHHSQTSFNTYLPTYLIFDFSNIDDGSHSTRIGIYDSVWY